MLRFTDAVTPEPLSAGIASSFKLRVGDWRITYEIGRNIINRGIFEGK
jgi:hypothetical protein